MLEPRPQIARPGGCLLRILVVATVADAISNSQPYNLPHIVQNEGT